MKFLCLALSLSLLICSCGLQNVEKGFVPSFTTIKNDSSETLPETEKKEIFYGTLTPVEITAMFNRLGVPYSSDVINPVSNHEMYLSSSKAALNTGVYGVDFGYLKLFGVGQVMIDYAVTIHELSNKLGIPDDNLKDVMRLMQNNISDSDSIMSIMNESFLEMDDHLRKSGRESTAGLMIMGGWIEAMYIACNLVYDPENPDPEVIQKIAEQKYSLNSLLSLIKNYYDDPVVVYYSKKLKFLNNYFNTFSIYFMKGDLEIDTVKKVFRASGSEMDVTIETLNNIRDYVTALRGEIVMP